MPKTDLKVDWATHEATRHACVHYHYSKSVPVPPLLKVGAWECGKFIGVVVFSRGASSNLLKPYGLSQTEGCELTRIALTKHTTPVTRVMRFAVRLLMEKCPSLRLVVSFADPHQGHHGGVYQAGNWLYVGDTAPAKEFWHNGRRYHSRQISAKGWNIQQGAKRKTLRPSDCQIIETPGKHRYLLPLDKRMARQVEPLRKPYPKRVGSGDSDTPGSQPGKGGAIPTPALQIPEAAG